MKLKEIEKNNRDFISGLVFGAVFFGLGGLLVGCCLMEWILWK